MYIIISNYDLIHDADNIWNIIRTLRYKIKLVIFNALVPISHPKLLKQQKMNIFDIKRVRASKVVLYSIYSHSSSVKLLKVGIFIELI